jgi:hypothetical protein
MVDLVGDRHHGWRWLHRDALQAAKSLTSCFTGVQLAGDIPLSLSHRTSLSLCARDVGASVENAPPRKYR